MSETLELYAVKNQDGQWFRRKGYGGYGKTWVDDFSGARIYNNIGPARAIISFFANNYPGYKAPTLVRLVISRVIEVNESERVENQKRKKMISKAQAEKRLREYQLSLAQQKVESAKAEIIKIKQELGLP